MSLLPITSIHYPPTCNENTQAYHVEVNSLDLTSNSRDLFTRKCVAARGENLQSDLGSSRVNIAAD